MLGQIIVGESHDKVMELSESIANRSGCKKRHWTSDNWLRSERPASITRIGSDGEADVAVIDDKRRTS